MQCKTLQADSSWTFSPDLNASEETKRRARVGASEVRELERIRARAVSERFEGLRHEADRKLRELKKRAQQEEAARRRREANEADAARRERVAAERRERAAAAERQRIEQDRQARLRREEDRAEAQRREDAAREERQEAQRQPPSPSCEQRDGRREKQGVRQHFVAIHAELH